ncbi:MAG TPA: hypothetical protein ENJ25_03055 [Firmicutes bacterium]|uniref:DUF4168 domain-containing protein n=1 Tax=candidate division TA06 bacterium TaxID=2250710 RepID=A0A660S5R0_UNCT6|nr:MAG: hypothetical protein DRP44_07440 [candidate division TA06 bacterium]HFD05104.1 hypothetical protein [Bacillota bacterium]
MRSVKAVIILIIAIFILSSCEKVNNSNPKSANKNNGSVTKFTPPADGKITNKQIYKYIKAAKMLQNQIAVNAQERNDILKSYKIKNDSILSDTVFMKKHPEVRKSLDSLETVWSNREKEIYSSTGLTEDEFIWIASVLPDSVNAKMRKIVQDSLKVK